MQIVDSDSVERDKLAAIFFFDSGDAPDHMINGDRWWIAASAIGKNAGDKSWEDWQNNYFVGFNTLVGATVSEIPDQFNSELQSWVEEWVRQYNFQSNLGSFGDMGVHTRPIDLAAMKFHYAKFYDRKRFCTWGLAYLMF